MRASRLQLHGSRGRRLWQVTAASTARTPSRSLSSAAVATTPAATDPSASPGTAQSCRFSAQRTFPSAPTIDVLFLRHAHRLAAPLGDRRRRLQLDREPHARDDLRVAAAGHAVLVVPQADQRTGAVAVQADRVRVDRAVDVLAPSCARARRPRISLPVRPGRNLVHHDVLQRVRVGERARAGPRARRSRRAAARRRCAACRC